MVNNRYRNNVTRDMASAKERDVAVKNMEIEIKAGLFHCTKLPDRETQILSRKFMV